VRRGFNLKRPTSTVSGAADGALAAADGAAGIGNFDTSGKALELSGRGSAGGGTIGKSGVTIGSLLCSSTVDSLGMRRVMRFGAAEASPGISRGGGSSTATAGWACGTIVSSGVFASTIEGGGAETASGRMRGFNRSEGRGAFSSLMMGKKWVGSPGGLAVGRRDELGRND
jgi:hypothetical protein